MLGVKLVSLVVLIAFVQLVSSKLSVPFIEKLCKGGDDILLLFGKSMKCQDKLYAKYSVEQKACYKSVYGKPEPQDPTAFKKMVCAGGKISDPAKMTKMKDCSTAGAKKVGLNMPDAEYFGKIRTCMGSLKQ